MAELPINPHLAYGGTACPGRLVEILDQLKEDDMATVKEITDLLNGQSHHLVFGKDMLLDQMKRIGAAEETRAAARHKELMTALGADKDGAHKH